MSYHYERIEEAIRFLQTQPESPPDLATLAEHVHMSPTHFQRIFTEWAGVSPKELLQYTRATYAKEALANRGSLFDVSESMGLSSTSRLHDLFIRLEAMTPAQFRSGGADLTIQYEEANTRFGQALIASTQLEYVTSALSSQQKIN